MTLEADLVDTIRRHGPLTVAAFMERALYDPARGYYTTASCRSGRAGDFYTSVDAGPLYGALVATLVERGAAALASGDGRDAPFDLVEAGAGSGRLARDVLDALAARHPLMYRRVRLHLVERSQAARDAQRVTLGPHALRLVSSGDALPRAVHGLVFANELLDAMPVHRVVVTMAGLREVVVDVDGDRLVTRTVPLSTPRLATYFDDLGFRPPVGAMADVSLAAIEWMAGAARSLACGVLAVVDYGHEAARLFDERHADGTLVGYWRHLADAPFGGVDATRPRWLERPGEQDLTAHVDFTSVRRAATSAGLEPIATLDQARFLLALGVGDELAAAGTDVAATRRRLAARTLVHPSGLGGSHHALVFRTPGLGTDLGLGER
jgi:SAM-dependent MidA family methyltransferase